MRLVLPFHLQVLHAIVLEVSFRNVVVPFPVLDLQISHLRVHGYRDIRSQRPGSRRPDQQRSSFLTSDWESHKDGSVSSDPPPFGHFHLRKARSASSAPRHDVMPAVDETFRVTLLQEGPDGVIVLVRKSEVAAAKLGRAQFANNFAGSRSLRMAAGQFRRDNAIAVGQRIAQGDQHLGIVPIAPIPQADGLFRLARGIRQHAFFARAHELLNTEFANFAFRLEPHALLDFDLYPQSLAIESVLVAQRAAAHSVVALVHVLKRAAPSVMHAHGIICGDRPVKKRPARPAHILPPELLKNPFLLPEAQNLSLHRRKIRHSRHCFVHTHSRIQLDYHSPQTPTRSEEQDHLTQRRALTTIDKCRTKPSARLMASVRKLSSALIFSARLQASDSIGTTLPLTTLSPTLGATIAK